MSQGAINIDHSRARRLVAKPQRRLYLRSDQKKKRQAKKKRRRRRRENEKGKSQEIRRIGEKRNFRNFLRCSHNSDRERRGGGEGGRERERECSSLGGKCESPRGANCVFSFRCPIQLKSLEYNSLRFNVRRGATGGTRSEWLRRCRREREGVEGAGGRKSLIYSVNGVIRTRRRPYLVYQPVGIMSF